MHVDCQSTKVKKKKNSNPFLIQLHNNPFSPSLTFFVKSNICNIWHRIMALSFLYCISQMVTPFIFQQQPRMPLTLTNSQDIGVTAVLWVVQNLNNISSAGVLWWSLSTDGHVGGGLTNRAQQQMVYRLHLCRY